MRNMERNIQKIRIGRGKNIKNEAETTACGGIGGWLTAMGIMGAAVMLVLAMLPSAAENVKPYSYGEAVAVMSKAVSENTEQKEELVLPDKKTYAAEDESIFEDIGEFFASLILGEG